MAFERLGQCADLVHFDQNGVGDPLLDAARENLGVGDVDIVADKLNFLAERIGHELPAIPIVLGHAVFN